MKFGSFLKLWKEASLAIPRNSIHDVRRELNSRSQYLDKELLRLEISVVSEKEHANGEVEEFPGKEDGEVVFFRLYAVLEGHPKVIPLGDYTTSAGVYITAEMATKGLGVPVLRPGEEP